MRVAFHKIATKLGGLRLKNALAALDEGDFATAAKIALEYYDKTYQYCLENNSSPEIQYLKMDTGDPEIIARKLTT